MFVLIFHEPRTLTQTGHRCHRAAAPGSRRADGTRSRLALAALYPLYRSGQQKIVNNRHRGYRRRTPMRADFFRLSANCACARPESKFPSLHDALVSVRFSWGSQRSVGQRSVVFCNPLVRTYQHILGDRAGQSSAVSMLACVTWCSRHRLPHTYTSFGNYDIT